MSKAWLTSREEDVCFLRLDLYCKLFYGPAAQLSPPLGRAALIYKITPTMIKKLLKKGNVLITLILNAIIRYCPKLFKTVEIILIPKQGKDSSKVSFYTPYYNQNTRDTTDTKGKL